MLKLKLSAKAKKRINYYHNWYCKESNSIIVNAFTYEINNAMNSVAKNPYIASIYDESSALRKYVVRKYPSCYLL